MRREKLIVGYWSLIIGYLAALVFWLHSPPSMTTDQLLTTKEISRMDDPNPVTMKRVLFLCTGNSCRSQMAEGLLRDLAGDRLECLSAGAKPAGFVHPLAVAVMREAGIDISSQTSKSINDFLPPEGTPPDLIISVCGNAERECPFFPGRVERWHWPFDDPAHATGTDAERLNEFRRVRDEIKAKIESGLVAASRQHNSQAN